MREYAGTINGSNCLVAGYGRIGKVLAWMLRGIGAKVTVSARRTSDLAWVELFGYQAVKTDDICDRDQYDLIFNTIPALVFNRRMLSKAREGTILIDLASAPGGVDYEAAEKLGIRVIKRCPCRAGCTKGGWGDHQKHHLQHHGGVRTLNDLTFGYALCGSFCTFPNP